MSQQLQPSEWQTNDLPYVEFSYVTGDQVVFGKEVMKAGGGGPLHRHSYTEELIFVAEGEVEVTIGEETCTLKPGDAIVIPPGAVHGVNTPNGATFYLTFSPSRGQLPSYDYERLDQKAAEAPV